MSLDADKLVLGSQASELTTRVTSQGRDLVYQVSRDSGVTDQTTNYVEINAGKLSVKANQISAELGARDSIEALSQRPGLAWMEQLANDPQFKDKIDWQRIEEVHKNWDHDQQGLTPEGAAIVTLVVAYFTAGAATEFAAAAGEAAATTATGGVAVLGEGGFIAAGGVTISTAVSGAITAGLSALASQAAVALINNQGDLGATLKDLGSSGSVKALLTAVITGGVLGALDLNPTGLPTKGAGSQSFFNQLGQNLQAGAARALVDTAINGGSLEDSLKGALKSAVLDTIAAQGANAIGDLTQPGKLDAFANKVAHAIAGCVVGVAKADSASGCAPGALGAAVGELAAEAYGRKGDTTQFAALISGLAVAVAGGDAGQIQIGSQAGANAAANNYLDHDQWASLAREFAECQQKPEGCSAQDERALREAYQRLSDAQDKALAIACSDAGSAKCKEMLAEAQRGSAYQEFLVLTEALPDYYLAGSDFNANVRLARQRVDAYDIVMACSANPAQCDKQRLDGAMRLVMTGVSLAALTAFSLELGAVGVGMLAEGGGTYCAARPQQCINLINGVAEILGDTPSSGVSVASSWARKIPNGYQVISMTGLPARTTAIADSVTGEVKLLTTGGKIIDVPPAPLPPWSSAADNVDVKIVWGKGIKEQGEPWEKYLDGLLPPGSQLPPNFKTSDFYDPSTGTAVSAKTLDTMTDAKISKPGQIYSSLKQNIDVAVNFSFESKGGVILESNDILAKELHLAVPASTTPAQWVEIKNAVDYGASNGVKVIVTGVR